MHSAASENPCQIIEFCVGQTSDRRDYYAVMKMEFARYAEFRKAMRAQQANMNLHSYGEVLESGWGNQVPLDVAHRIYQEYPNLAAM